MNKQPLRAGIIGASGYAGQELVRLVARHPNMRLDFATSESGAGKPIPGVGGRYVSVNDAPFDAVDVIFSCLPPGSSGPWALRARDSGALSVDLSSDFRDGGEGAVYGLTELWRDEIRDARLIANPGCYPTSALLALAPAVRSEIIDLSRPVIINAASGVTGAGRTAKRELLFAEVAEDFRAYGVGNQHRHVPEIGRSLSRMGEAPEFIFTPHLLPVRRGILETIYLPLKEPLSHSGAIELWSSAYEGEPFIEIEGEGLPTLQSAVGRNVVSIGFSEIDVEQPTLLIVTAIDNLLKGAAGQALQNANLALGLEETEGLLI